MIIADTHVHLYRCYDLDRALSFAHANLERLAPGAEKVLFLTERAGDDAFRELGEAGPEPEVVRTRGLTIVAGRQIITRERIEVLGLVADFRPEDGQPIEATLAAVREAGAVPVLPWSPGKWMGGRGRIVRSLVEAAEPGTLLCGDTAMRARLVPRPSILKLAARRGLMVVPGTDPLPFAGDEQVIGTYAAKWDRPLDAERPATALRALLTDPAAAPTFAGKRNALPKAAARWLGNRRAKSN